MIVGVSDEGMGTLKKWADAKGVTYPIVNAPKALATYKVGAFPTAFTVDERGKIARRGKLSKSEIEASLKRVRWLPDLGETPLLKSLSGMWKAGKFADLDKKLTQAASDASLDEADKAGVERLRGLYDKLAGSTRQEVDAWKEGPDYAAVEDRLREIEKQWASLPLSAAAKSAQDALRKDKEIKPELDASRKLNDLLARSGDDMKKLTPALQALIRKYPDSFAASQARDLLLKR